MSACRYVSLLGIARYYYSCYLLVLSDYSWSNLVVLKIVAPQYIYIYIPKYYNSYYGAPGRLKTGQNRGLGLRVDNDDSHSKTP